jgi:hypothetical protein
MAEATPTNEAQQLANKVFESITQALTTAKRDGLGFYFDTTLDVPTMWRLRLLEFFEDPQCDIIRQQMNQYLDPLESSPDLAHQEVGQMYRHALNNMFPVIWPKAQTGAS